MKPVFARAALGACIVAMAGQPVFAAEGTDQGYDGATSTLSELIRRAEKNILKVDLLIEQQKAAERNALKDAEARKLFEQGNDLYASGDLDGAKKAWAEALHVTANPEMQSYIAEQQRKADEKAASERAEKAAAERLSAEKARQEAAALKARKRELFAQGKGLFETGDLDGAEAKFRELLVLDMEYPMAKEYIDARIPACREELRLQAEKESMARDAFDRGNAMFAKGDLEGARAAWHEALRIADHRDMRADIERKEASAAVSATGRDAVEEHPADVRKEAPAPRASVPPAAVPEKMAVAAAHSGGRFVLAKGANGVPAGEGVTVVTGSAKKVYFISDPKIVAGERITHVWEYDGKVVARFPVGLVGRTRRTVWSVKGIPAGSTGTWTVRTVAADGRELSSESFNYVNE